MKKPFKSLLFIGSSIYLLAIVFVSALLIAAFTEKETLEKIPLRSLPSSLGRQSYDADQGTSTKRVSIERSQEKVSSVLLTKSDSSASDNMVLTRVDSTAADTSTVSIQRIR